MLPKKGLILPNCMSPKLLSHSANIFVRIYPSYPWHFATLDKLRMTIDKWQIRSQKILWDLKLCCIIIRVFRLGKRIDYIAIFSILLLKEIVFAGKFCQTPWCQAKPPPCLNNGKKISWKYNIVPCHYFLFGREKELWTTIIQNFGRKIYHRYIIECHYFNGDRYLQRHCASYQSIIIISIHLLTLKPLNHDHHHH